MAGEEQFTALFNLFKGAVEGQTIVDVRAYWGLQKIEIELSNGKTLKYPIPQALIDIEEA